MREIKFRAWNKEKEIMCFDNEDDSADYWDGVKASDIGVINGRLRSGGEFSYRNEYDVMQFTGLKDKNGREIYEGDIVRFMDHDNTGGHRDDREHTGIVKYQSGLYEIWKNNDSEYYGSDGAFILNYAWLQDDEFEVIGNIHENADLLENADD